MTPWLWIAIGTIAGVPLTFGVAYGIDWVRSWYYRTFRLKELRERPPVSKRIEVINVGRTLDGWAATAYSNAFKDAVKVGWDTGDHPMDAVRNLIETVEKEGNT